MKNSFVIYSVLYACMNVFGATFIKQEIAKQTLSNLADFIQLLLNPKVIFGFGIIFLSALVLFKALSLGKFSMVIPIATGVNFVLTVCLGVMIFKDKLNVFSFIGLAMILSGIILLSFKPSN